MKIKELRNMDRVSLRKKAKELKEEGFWLAFKLRTGQLEKNHNVGANRRALARVMTVLKEKQQHD